ncbi:hypothetical protein CJ030_MR0G025669 [Morella rubra]|uniref:Uncharacterized protein n=1 Tax=Morella rubra TaxID=262757 RepID=A0A6A1UFD6_9ROSI|nr:hypothetical protein CJ030_MR0G025669 [Morella rubra]
MELLVAALGCKICFLQILTSFARYGFTKNNAKISCRICFVKLCSRKLDFSPTPLARRPSRRRATTGSEGMPPVLSPIAVVHTGVVSEMRDIPEKGDILSSPVLTSSSPILDGTTPVADDLVGASSQFTALEPKLPETPSVDYSDAYESDLPDTPLAGHSNVDALPYIPSVDHSDLPGVEVALVGHSDVSKSEIPLAGPPTSIAKGSELPLVLSAKGKGILVLPVAKSESFEDIDLPTPAWRSWLYAQPLFVEEMMTECYPLPSHLMVERMARYCESTLGALNAAELSQDEEIESTRLQLGKLEDELNAKKQEMSEMQTVARSCCSQPETFNARVTALEDEKKEALNAELAEARRSTREAVDAMAMKRKKMKKDRAAFTVSLKRLSTSPALLGDPETLMRKCINIVLKHLSIA